MILAFQAPLDIVVVGVITGLIYGLLGIGLCLAYRSSRVINFAHGDVGALASGVMLLLVVRYHIPYGVALVAALAVGAVAGGATEFLVIRRLVDAPRLVVLVATIGVSRVLLAINLLVPRQDLGYARFPTPFHATVTVGNLRLHAGELLILTVVPAVTVALALYLRWSKTGLTARAAAENLEAARLAGARARRISLTIWILAALLSTASAVLLAPTQSSVNYQSLGPSLMVRALAAAVIGGLDSLPQVAAGGVAVGVVELLVSWNRPAGGYLDVVLLAMVLVSLLLRRTLGRAARGTQGSSWSLGGAVHALEPRLARLPRVRAGMALTIAGVLAVAAAGPALSIGSGRRVLLCSVILYALMGLSVTVLTGFAGQVSLSQFAFVALGAVVAGRAVQLGYPQWVALVFAAAAPGVVALLVGIPALRVRGLFLAVATLAFAVAAGSWVPQQSWLVNRSGATTSLHLDRPVIFGVSFRSELRYYWLCLAVLAVVAALVSHLRRTGLGRSLMAVRDNEAAAATLSVPPRRIKLVAFVLSGSIAGIAGFFYAGLLVDYAQANLFDPAESLALVAMVIFGGVTTVTGCVLGAVWIRGIPYLFGAKVGILSTGLGVLVVLQMAPGGLAALVMRARDRAATWLAREPAGVLESSDRALGVQRAPLPPTVEARRDGDEVVLRADGIVVRFGGLTAVDDVSIEARHGEIVGLVGPNGAGKTTMFDVLAGQVRPGRGQVVLGGVDVTSWPPERRVLLGLGRSFQEARLFPDLSLFDAFQLALEPAEPSEAVPSLLSLPSSWSSERRKRERAKELISLLGLGPYANRNCGELSTGTRRFAELGIMLAMGADVILLDEPTAGIAQREVEAFTPVLREIRAHLDATMVIIDHDIPMIMGLVDRLYVMAAGSVIAEGLPTVLRDDPAVIAAYLGTDERAIARSGAVSRPRRRRAAAGVGTDR
jgi:ABC-type branched-subunit amino acid transport system ATPase component/ABC-type branched-subunit amino acid transport system permease subunit